MLIEKNMIGSEDPEIAAAWWDEFLLKCKDFTETIVIKNVMSDKECDDMADMALSAVREICNRQTCDYDFRFYLGTENMGDEYLRKNIFPNPPLPGETLTDWANRAFPELKFGIILNYGEKFSPLLSESLGRFARPLLEKIGVPVNGICVTIFFGNYGFTPLGIHHDLMGENVIHFHLGPGGKIMYNWEPEEFKKLGGHQNYMKVEDMLPHAKEFPFGKGDIFYMPWNKYHIGYSDELSIGVTLWFNNITRKHMINKLISVIERRYVDLTDKTITKPERDVYNLQGFNEIEALFKYDEELASMPVVEFFNNNYKDNLRTLYCNGGWRARPLSLEEETGYDENEYEHLHGKQVQQVTPFTILYKISANNTKLEIYSRSTIIEVNYNPALISIIDQLNTGAIYDTADLVAGLTPEWPMETGLYFLSILYNTRAIQIVKSF